MDATQLLLAPLIPVNNIIHDLADDLTDVDWTTRVLPDTNLIAFELWHVARAQDWAVQTMICGVPELSADPIWSGRLGAPITQGIGVGLSQEQADQLAHALHRADILAYADAVHARILAWLGAISDDELEHVPDVTARIAPYAVYQEPALRETAPWVFENAPIWAFLTRACIGHARGHLAEVDLLKRQLRRQAGSRH